jgi:type IV secretion system T-DNA border endonuclease VirD2
MGRTYSAVDRVVGSLCDRRPKKNGGGSLGSRRHSGAGARPSTSRMSRVGASHGKAIFKSVPHSGTKSRSGLKGQLEYIFRDDKLARVIDPTGRLERHESVTNADLNTITLNWSKQWWKGTRDGNTSHMILSYPRGTSIEDVSEITRAVCNEMFNTGDETCKFVAANHDDQESHPHAHVVLNRRGSQNKIFRMVPGTDRSYEGFREAMAAHAARRNIYLDPTFRFERGITQAQPTREEQLTAQAERRAPVQQERTGPDLLRVQEQISFARIAYEAMAVIAANADCPRLERAYEEIAATLATSKGDFSVPALSQDEHQKFDSYVSFINDGLAQTERLLETKSIADRVPFEKRMSDTMVAFTALSPNANYAKALHEPPHTQSIYMHRLGEKGADLRAAEGQEVLQRVGKEYGLNPDAIAARLEVDAPNHYLEQLWVRSDMQQVAAAEGLDFDKDSAEIRDLLWNAHETMRQDLVDAKILTAIPHLQADYAYVPAQSKTYSFIPNRLAQDVAATMDHYREGGAPQDWINDNQDRILSETTARYAAEQRDYLAQHPEITRPIYDTIDTSNTDTFAIADEDAADRLLADLSERGLMRTDRQEMRSVVGSDLANRHSDMPHHVADALGRMYAAVHGARASSQPQQTEVEYGIANRLRWFQDIGKTQRVLTKDISENQELFEALKERLSEAQYDRLRHGDLSAVSEVTNDLTFARQLAVEVDLHENSLGNRLDHAQAGPMQDHRSALQATFAEENTHHDTRKM